MSGAYSLYYLGMNSKFCVWIRLEMAEWYIPFWVTLTLTLTSDLISRFFVSGAYLLITKNFPQNGLMLDQFRWVIHHVTVIFFLLAALPYILCGINLIQLRP